MRKVFLLLIVIIHPHHLVAEPLNFSQPLTVTIAEKGTFLHLDSSGRRSLAIAGGIVAVVWEDNRSGNPAVYVSYLLAGKTKFTPPEKLSQQSAAYEPVVIALSNHRFIAGWEENEQVWLRVIAPDKKGETINIATKPSRQINVASNGSANVGAVWAQGADNRAHIYYTDLNVTDFAISTSKPQMVDTSNDKNTQGFPVLQFTMTGRVVTWEDRRYGHTRIFAAFGPWNKSFEPYYLINELLPSPNPNFGKGTGAMRPVLSGNEKQTVIAGWMDKRDFRGGYDVYTALSGNGGKSFGKNEKSQDMFGDNTPQWHASVAMQNQSDIAAAAWDDTRNENPDVFYTIRVDGNWSDDYELPGAAGAGKQTHPVIEYDKHNILHAIWIDEQNGATSIKYAHSLP